MSTKLKLSNYKLALRGAPILILNDSYSLKNIQLHLFSNFLIMGINDAFLNYPDIDLLLLSDIKVIRKYKEELNKVRCIKIELGDSHVVRNSIQINTKKEKSEIKCDGTNTYSSNSQFLSIQISVLLGCNPILVSNFDKIEQKHLLANRGTLNNRLFSITPGGCIKNVDQFSICTKYNNKCPDKMWLLRKLS